MYTRGASLVACGLRWMDAARKARPPDGGHKTSGGQVLFEAHASSAAAANLSGQPARPGSAWAAPDAFQEVDMKSTKQRDVSPALRSEWEEVRRSGLVHEAEVAYVANHQAQLARGDDVPGLEPWEEALILEWASARLYARGYRRTAKEAAREEAEDIATESVKAGRDPEQVAVDRVGGTRQTVGGHVQIVSGKRRAGRDLLYWEEAAGGGRKSFAATGALADIGRLHRHVPSDAVSLAGGIVDQLGGFWAVEELRRLLGKTRPGKPTKAEAAARDLVRRAAWSVGGTLHYERFRSTAVALVLDWSRDRALYLLDSDPRGLGKRRGRNSRPASRGRHLAEPEPELCFCGEPSYKDGLCKMHHVELRRELRASGLVVRRPGHADISDS